MTRREYHGLSMIGRLVAVGTGLALLAVAFGTPLLHDVFDVLGVFLAILFLLAFVVVAGLFTGRLWDRLTGMGADEIRGRRSWSHDSGVQAVQRMQETHVMFGALNLLLFWVAGIVGLWLYGERWIAGVMTAMAVAGTVLVWALTRKRRPYRLKDHRRAQQERESRVLRDELSHELDDEMQWVDE